MRIRYTGRALTQLASVYEYLVVRSPNDAQTVTTSIKRTITLLQELPLLGKLTDEADVHVVIEPKYLYRIFYTVGDEVVVIRILHGRQR